MNDDSAEVPEPARPAVPEPDTARALDVVARLRAADPAAGAEPGDGLWAAVAARVEARADASPDELAARRARRWTTWPARAAGAAAVALLIGGGGGYAIGAAGSGGTEEDPAAPVIMLGDGAGPAADAQSFPAESGAGSTTEALPAPGGGADERSVYWFGHAVFTSSGLSEEGGSAPAWGFDPAAGFTEERVAAAAAALGVPGAPTRSDGFWTVGPTDGSGPAVSVYSDGVVSLNYYDPGKDPWACPVLGTEEQRKAEEADPSLTVIPEPDPCVARDLGPAPAGETATAIVSEVMAALGVDPSGLELVAENYGDEMWSYVSAFQVVDGQRTGVVWSGMLTGAGLQSFYGPLAPLVELGDYAVISPAAAVERLSDPRFGGGGGPIGWVGGREPTFEAGSAVTEPPSLPPGVQPGSTFRWPVTEAVIVEARLGLAMHTQVDGSAVLLPSYELTSADGGIWSVIAVDESHLDFTDAR